MNRRLTVAIRIVVIGVIAAGLWWFVREMDFAKLGESLRSARAWPLVLAAALNFVCLWGKAVCWRIMLAPRHKVGVNRLFRYTIAAFAASAIAPARAGEVLRVWTLKRRDGVPAADTAAVAVAEKLLDGISMLILVAPVPLLLHGLPWQAVATIVGCAAIALGMFIFLFIAVGRVGREAAQHGQADPTRPAADAHVEASAPPSLMRRFLAGMHVLRSPKRLLGSLALLIFVWAADLGEVMAVLYALGIDLPIAGGMLVLFSLNVAIAIPSTPAQAGALEVGALAALELLHVGHEQALAFALLYHALQVVPLIAAGMILEYRLVLGREGDAPSEPRSAASPAEPLPTAKVVSPEPAAKAPSAPPGAPRPSHTRT
jgi:glycosyltransferase 2 family protein